MILYAIAWALVTLAFAAVIYNVIQTTEHPTSDLDTNPYDDY